MKSSKLLTLTAALIFATTTAWSQNWLGNGNSTDPYLLKSSDYHYYVSDEVRKAKNFGYFSAYFMGNVLMGNVLKCLQIHVKLSKSYR